MNDLETIIRHYGLSNQLKKLHEEVYELTEAILDCYNMSKPAQIYKKHITEEIADCFVLLGQFIYYFDLDDDEINEVMDNKIERQLRRIEREKRKKELLKKELNNVQGTEETNR